MNHMKKFLAIALAAIFASSCIAFNSRLVRGNGEETVKEFEFPPITDISISGSMDVAYTQGTQSVSLLTDGNLTDIYKVEYSDGVLSIEVKKGYSIMPKVKTVLKVCSEDLSSVKINGSGDFNMDKLVTHGDFLFAVNGSGGIESAGLVCREFRARINGSGDIEVGDLTAESITTGINGSGDILLNLRDAGDINAYIAGSGDITLAGSARSLSFKIAGSGDMHTAGLRLTGEDEQ